MAVTYEPIATTTLGSAQATVTFSSISGSYTDLVLIASLGCSGDNYMTYRVNNDSGSNYSRTYLSGNGSSTSSGRSTNQTQFYSNAYFGTGTYATAIFNLQNYSNTTTYKTILQRSNDAGSSVEATSTLWRSTNAINRIDIIAPSGNITSGSTFTLYGIKAA